MQLEILHRKNNYAAYTCNFTFGKEIEKLDFKNKEQLYADLVLELSAFNFNLKD